MTAPGFLLDANVLIALVIREHEHHVRVGRWIGTAGPVALCPVVEGALTRFLIRVGESPATAGELLRGLYASGRVGFWPDELSHADVDLSHVTGHRQVTDAYLAALSDAHGARLATLDEGLAAALPETCLLIPVESPTG